MMDCPWRKIWTHPKATIAQVIAQNPKRSIWWLASIYGFSSGLSIFQSLSLGWFLEPLPLLLLALLFAPFWGYMLFAFWAWVMLLTGKWFKGKGSFAEIRAAYAWSCVPYALNIPLWFAMVWLFGRLAFMNFPEGYLLSGPQIALVLLLVLAKVTLAIWALVIYFNALAQVQQYSVLRAIFNFLVAALLVGAIFSILWSLALYIVGIPSGIASVLF